MMKLKCTLIDRRPAFNWNTQLMNGLDNVEIDGYTLKGALWVIRARFQGNKAAKCTFFFIMISVPSFSFEKKLLL